MPVTIHGNEYVTVAERLIEAGKNLLSVSTEVLYQNPVVIRATITTTRGSFQGISAANPGKPIEKQSPYEVAETSAVGRALGFAGYGAIENIASADEVHKAMQTDEEPTGRKVVAFDTDIKGLPLWCDFHDCAMFKNKNGNRYHKEGDEFCNGSGFPSEKADWTRQLDEEKA